MSYQVMLVLFLALNLLDTITSLRCEDDDDLLVQCDVFEEELHADIEALDELKSSSVNLNDHQSVFTAVNKKVTICTDGTCMMCLLTQLVNSKQWWGVAQWVARLTRDRWIPVSREFEPTLFP